MLAASVRARHLVNSVIEFSVLLRLLAYHFSYNCLYVEEVQDILKVKSKIGYRYHIDYSIER
jgi:hypothetical protein